MVDVVKAFGWTYVSTLADEGNYGEKGIAAFEELAEQSGICTARSQKIPRTLAKDTLTNILSDFAVNHPRARIIVMFVNEDNCRYVRCCGKFCVFSDKTCNCGNVLCHSPR